MDENEAQDRSVMVLHNDGVPVIGHGTLVYVVRTQDIVQFLDKFPVPAPFEWIATPGHDLTDLSTQLRKGG